MGQSSRSSTIGSAVYDHVTLRVSDLVAGTSLSRQCSISSRKTDRQDAELLNRERSRQPTRIIRSRRASTSRSSRRARITSITSGRPASPQALPTTAPRAPVGVSYADDYYAAFVQRPQPKQLSKPYTRDGRRPGGNIDRGEMRAAQVETSTAFYSTISDAAGLTLAAHRPRQRKTRCIRRLTPQIHRPSDADHTTCTVLRHEQRRTPLPRRRNRGRVSQQRRAGGDRAPTAATTPPMPSTPTATTSKSSTTTASDKTEPEHRGRRRLRCLSLLPVHPLIDDIRSRPRSIRGRCGPSSAAIASTKSSSIHLADPARSRTPSSVMTSKSRT